MTVPFKMTLLGQLDAFPTTAIFDAFNRANESPLSGGGNWTTGDWWDNLAVLESNRIRMAAGDPAGYAGAQWAAAFTGAVEAYATFVTGGPIDTATPRYFEVDILDATSTAGSPNGYVVGFEGTGLVLGRYDAGTFAKRATANVTVGDGDAIGVAYNPLSGRLQAWHRAASNGVWVRVAEVVDATYRGPWNLEFGIQGAPILDDCGGGST